MQVQLTFALPVLDKECTLRGALLLLCPAFFHQQHKQGLTIAAVS